MNGDNIFTGRIVWTCGEIEVRFERVYGMIQFQELQQWEIKGLDKIIFYQTYFYTENKNYFTYLKSMLIKLQVSIKLDRIKDFI